MCTFSLALAWVSCNPVSVLPRAQSSIYTHCPLQGQASPSGSACTTSPYGGSSLVFCCLGAFEVHQTRESNLSTALFLLYCDISLSGQSDKSHMASPHERTAAASSRCCSVDMEWKTWFQEQYPSYCSLCLGRGDPVLDLCEV